MQRQPHTPDLYQSIAPIEGEIRNCPVFPGSWELKSTRFRAGSQMPLYWRAGGCNLPGSDEKPMTITKMLVKFQINNTAYGVDIDLVKEILTQYTLIPAPVQRRNFAGIIQLRGDTIPVLHFGTSVKTTNATGKSSAERVIVMGTMNAMGESFGLMVDSIHSVIEVGDTIQLTESTDGDAIHPFIMGVLSGKAIKSEENNREVGDALHSPVIILDSDKLMKFISE